MSDRHWISVCVKCFHRLTDHDDHKCANEECDCGWKETRNELG